ncbi:MAG: hypothetical protein ACOYJ6_14545 [Caulobacterales bacterium]|jgi:hypothetical protein
MSLFPPSTNSAYRGATISAWFLMLAGVMELIPGCIHYFLPDGGAGVIGGLDLSTRRETIIAIFAWFGALQIPFALMLFIIGLRYRTLVPLGLMAVIIARALMAYDGWFGKASQSGHHPPEHYGSPVAVVLGLVFLLLALRNSRSKTP